MALTAQTKSGIPLITTDVAEAPRLDVGWTTLKGLGIPVGEVKQPAKKSSRAGAPSARVHQPIGLPPRHRGAAKKGPVVTSSEGVRELAKLIVKDEDGDKSNDKVYQARINHLIDNHSKYDLFSRIYPQATLPFTIRVNGITVPKPQKESDLGDNGQGAWYEVDNYGARVKVIGGDEKSFFTAITAKLELPPEEPGLSPRITKLTRGVGIVLIYSNNHPNVLWITPEKEIWRYEPHYPFNNAEQRYIDSALTGFFKVYLPSFTYNPHKLRVDECVAAVRGKNRIETVDYLCEDYVLLYLMRRMKGMGHEEAAVSLVKEGDAILKEEEDLLYILGMKYRELKPNQ